MYDRFTDRARQVMQLANAEAQRFNHEYVGTEHILLGLIKEGAGVAANVLKNLQIDVRKIRKEVEKIIQTGPGAERVTMGRLPQTPRAKKVIEYAVAEARSLNHNYVGTEHLLLGLVRERDGVAAQVLMNLGLKLEDVRAEILDLLGHNTPPDRAAHGTAPAPESTAALDAVGRVVDGSEPAHCRPADLRRILAALSRHRRRPVVLLAESAALRAAEARQLAAALAAGAAPAFPGGWRVFDLNLGRVVQRVRPVEVKDHVGTILSKARELRVVFFVNDFHTALCSESGAAAWQALAHGVESSGVPLVAAATPAEYRRLVEAGRVVPEEVVEIEVAPASAAKALEIVKGWRGRFEEYHHVRITDAALAAAVELAGHHFGSGCLPDKAIDVIDEAAARVRLQLAIPPPDLAGMDERVRRVKLDTESAIADQDFETAARLREQSRVLQQQREKLVRDWGERTKGTDVVDEAAVREVVTEMAGGRPPA